MDAVEVGVQDVPIELVEMIIGFLPMKDALRSAALVCKQWHSLFQESGSLWSVFFQRDIVELHNPYPYGPRKQERGKSDEKEDSEKTWKEMCVEAFAHVRLPLTDASPDWAWIIHHGYLGLARIMLPHMPPDPKMDRIGSLLLNINNDEYSFNLINAFRCMVALGYSPRTTDPEDSTWRYGGFLHISTSTADSLIINFLLNEFCSPDVDENLRLDINEHCTSDGFTPLHCLFENSGMHKKTDEKLRESLMLLLQKGANPSLRNQAGKDCIEFATEEGLVESARIMIPYRKDTK